MIYKTAREGNCSLKAWMQHNFDVIGNSLSFRQISVVPLPRLESNKNMREIIQRHLFHNAFNQTMDICLRLLLNFSLRDDQVRQFMTKPIKKGPKSFPAVCTSSSYIFAILSSSIFATIFAYSCFYVAGF